MTTPNLNGNVGNAGQEGLERPEKPERLSGLEGLRQHEELKGHEGSDGGKETARERKLVESRREREFYSYYESVLAYANTEPKFCDLHSLDAIAEHKAVPSADKTLTALVQLAALRIGTRRAMIFFFDEEYAYIIAESTRTLSLDDYSQHAPKDSLWLGFTKIPRGLSICEATADLPANEGSNAQDRHSATLAHIINDLTEDTRFCDRPYVKDGPKARFYAGVPITTPGGINIGALCVLDDKPRNGLEHGQIEFLRSMASTVMSHLELLRAKEENQRSRDMNAALAAFVEGKSNSEDWWHCNARSHDHEAPDNSTAGPRGSRIRTPSERIPPASQGTDSHPEKSVDSAPGGYFAEHQPPHNPHIPYDDRPQSGSLASPGSTVDGNIVSTPTTGHITSPLTPESPQPTDLPARVRATASRAASLIQKGIGADGILFLDATVGSVGGVIDSNQTLSQTESETDVSRGSDSSMKHAPTNLHHGEDVNFAKKSLDLPPPPDSVILGSAYSADIEARVQSAIEQAKISEKILKSLLRRYPNGQIWHFNAEGDASDEDDELLDELLDDNLSATDAGGSTGSELEPELKSPTTKRAGRRDRALKRDGRAIQSIFPGLRSLIFLGMWDPHQERWFGACIAVSYSSMRIFSPQHELSYLAAFCDVVLAEIWRLEAQEIGRSKNVFVSTISHELRSPLGMEPTATHGILGSAECLEEQQHSALSAELIRSITSCGNTLLDVVNDLLEYSRLNHDTRKRRNLQLTGQAGTTASEARSAYADTESGVNISTLTEDAVTAARLGFEQPSARSQDIHGVEVDHSAVLILNIEDALSLDWMFSVASGSWKRICINLVTNALKYTPSGYINVTLHKTMLKRKPGKPQTALVELIVEDSGIGMSEEFQAKDLFRPFRQENNLTPGTGLGLNLVGQTVKSLGGTVHVRSNKGRGTTVKVSLPLKSLAPAPSLNSSEVSQVSSSSQESVGFFGFGTPEASSTTGPTKAKASRRLLNSMKRYCTQLGVPVYATDDDTTNSASIHILSEHALENSSQIHDGDSRRSTLATNNLQKPIIVICATGASASRLRSGPLGRGLPSTTQYLWLPIGPAKLAAALAIRPGGLAENGPDSVAASTKTDSVATGEDEEKEGRRKEDGNPAQTTDVVSPMRDKGKSAETFTPMTTNPMNGEKSHSPLSPMSPLARKNGGSESEADEPIHSPLPTRERVDRRSSTSASANTENSMSLLLVDDNAINLRLLEVFAKKAGHTYRTAKNGQEAVKIYENSVDQKDATTPPPPPDDGGSSSASANPQDPTRPPLHHHPTSPSPAPPQPQKKPKPEVILLDLNMPVMDGFSAARAIRRFEQASGCARATIVAVTGLGDVAAQERAFASGMDLFLTKPVKMREVRDVLEGVREGRG